MWGILEFTCKSARFAQLSLPQKSVLIKALLCFLLASLKV